MFSAVLASDLTLALLEQMTITANCSYYNEVDDPRSPVRMFFVSYFSTSFFSPVIHLLVTSAKRQIASREFRSSSGFLERLEYRELTVE